MNRWIFVAAILVPTTACDSGTKDAAPAEKADGKADAKADGKADAKADAKADGDAGAGVVVDTKGAVAPSGKVGATPTPMPGL